MTIFFARAIVFASLLLLHSNAANASPRNRMEADVERILREERLAGVTWALVKPDGVKTGAAGFSNYPRQIRIKAGDRVHIGSVTKTLVAVGLLRLASEGRLDLDAPVDLILPELQFRNPWAQTHPLRVRHLLDHTGGLEDLRIRQMFSDRAAPNAPLAEAFNGYRDLLRVRTRPGEMFSYSNIGYALAGMILERVTGSPYEHWLDANLLRPLGMDDSTFRFVTQSGNRASQLAWGHNDNLSLAAALPVALRPAAQFTTSARDMAKFARFLMSDGTVGGRPFVTPALLRAMGAPVETAAARAGLPLGYRFGLVSRNRDGHVGRCHSGNIVGYRSMLCIYPGQQKAFFYSVNTDGESANYARLDKAMTSMLALTSQVGTAARPQDFRTDPWDGQYIPAISGIRLERYTDVLLEGLRLSSAPGHIILTDGGGEPRRLISLGDGIFRASERTLPSHALLSGPDGERIITDGLRTFHRVPGLLIPALWVSLGLGVLGMVYSVVVLPFRVRRNGRPPLQPLTVAPLLLVSGVALMYFQPFTRLGDLTLASALLAAGSTALLAGAIIQAVLALRHRQRLWQLEFGFALAVLQWSIVLAQFDLIPLALWA